MSELSVSERRIRPIQDAVASSNWKQALKECEKWAKKGEKSDKFLALKAYILINQPDKAQHGRGEAEVLTLCKRDPPITDHDAIYQLQDALKALSLHDSEGSKLWERAVAAKQNDKDLYMRWLNQAIADGNWLSAQKAAMGLRKSFPKERQYEFWAIQMCYLVHRDLSIPEKNRSLFGTLAYRMVSKAAETIPTDQEQMLAPGKAISTPEEVSLLVQILKATGRQSEAVKLFQSEPLNIQSRVSQQDPQVVVSLFLDCLEESEQWDEAFTTCQMLLSTAEHSQDDRIWKLWLKARGESTQEGIAEIADKALDAACNAKPVNRAAYMARINVLAACKSENAPQTDLLEVCEQYASAFSDRAFCFDDMKPALNKLDKLNLDKLITEYSEESQRNSTKLFGLKLEYYSLSRGCSGQDLVDFSTRALEVYRECQPGTHPQPEAALLAALSILKLPVKGKKHILLAAVLLALARSQNEDYYTFTVALIQLYKFLGVLSLSMESFNRLSVKNMQYETVAHLLLTRISTLHPNTTSASDEKLSPGTLIDTGLSILENADMALVRGIREGLRFNSYSNIYNSVEMRLRIQDSMNRQVFAIEERKLRRMWSIPDDTVLPLRPDRLVDQRDFSYFPSYHGEEDVALLARFRKSLPKEAWIDAMSLFDHLSTYLKAELLTQSGTAGKALVHLKAVWESLQNTELTGSEDLTVAELTNFECHKLLALAVVDSAEPLSQAKLNDIATGLKAWLQERLEDSQKVAPDLTVGDVSLPTCNYPHTCLTTLETLQTIAMYLAFSLKKAKSGKGKTALLSKEAITELQDLASQVEKAVHDSAKKAKDSINEPGLLGKLVDLAMARDGVEGLDLTALESVIENITDEVNVETACGRLRESWEDTVDGILAVKVKTWK